MKGKLAFPISIHPDRDWHEGMTYREWLAGMALTTMQVNSQPFFFYRSTNVNAESGLDPNKIKIEPGQTCEVEDIQVVDSTKYMAEAAVKLADALIEELQKKPPK